MNGKVGTASAIVGVFVLAALMLFISPLIALLVGWFVGFVIELITGTYTTDSLNVLVGKDRFAQGDFARLTAVAAVIGSFFKSNKKGGD